MVGSGAVVSSRMDHYCQLLPLVRRVKDCVGLGVPGGHGDGCALAENVHGGDARAVAGAREAAEGGEDVRRAHARERGEAVDAALRAEGAAAKLRPLPHKRLAHGQREGARRRARAGEGAGPNAGRGHERGARGLEPPRKGGPGICKSDLLVINKIDLAPLVGASLDVMERDTLKMRGDKPFVFSNQKTGQGLEQIIAFIERHGMLNAA